MADDIREPIAEEEDDTLVLIDEEGNQETFTYLATMNAGGQTYVVLAPMLPDDEEPEEVTILRLEEENGEDVLVEIDDEDEMDRVEAAWGQICDEAEQPVQ